MELQPMIEESLEIHEVKCKNCKSQIEESATFCQQCGAKFVNYRLTVRKITNDFLSDYIGLDNKYFQTFYNFLKSPGLVCQEFISGVRKKYQSPFTFLAIGLTVSLLLYTTFPDEYLNLMQMTLPDSYYKTLFDLSYTKTPELVGSPEYIEEFIKFKEEQQLGSKKSSEFLLRYFNIYAFLTIPFYTLIAFLTFGWKKINFGEHLVITCYIQGFSMITITMFFVVSLFFDINGFLYNMILLAMYYLITYKQLLKLSWGKTFLNLLKFPIVATSIFLAISIFIGIGTFLFTTKF